MYPQLVVVALLVLIIPNFFFCSSFYSVFVFCFHNKQLAGQDTQQHPSKPLANLLG
jgi:hypothetical protein